MKPNTPNTSAKIKSAMTKPDSKGDKKGRSNNHKKKNFRFIELHNKVTEIPSVFDMTQEEVDTLWWTNEEFYEFKLTARRAAKEARKSAGVLSWGIDEAYAEAERLAASIEDEASMENVIGAVNIGLTQWCTHRDTRRGMERYNSRTLRAAVESSRIPHVHLRHLTPDELCKCSQQRSRASRIFARMIGQADAVAALPENPVTKAPTMRQSPQYTTMKRHAASRARRPNHRGLAAGTA